jgi:hypothetical protein
VFVVTGCGAGAGAGTFQRVANGSKSGNASGSRPQVLLALSAAQRPALLEHVNTEDRASLTAVDLGAAGLLEVSLGLKPSSGYGVQVISLRRDGHRLEVTVRLRSPAPGEPTLQEFQAPYDVVAVPRDELKAVTEYSLRSEGGALLASGPAG